MIVTFKSAASGDVIMFGEVAQRLMRCMGKDVTEQGIVTVEQLPGAIAALKAAIAEDKAARAGGASADEDDAPKDIAAPVSLAQRAIPLLELLEWAERKKKPVTWGV